MALAPGTRLGPYEVVAPLGAGGMGEVYRARDTKLGREVALKLLPDHFAHDPERLARFEREAKTLAALNHPHIAQIHGFEDASGLRALVMELVEGPTLADRIAEGPLPLDEALPIARQIAEALEAAHDQGIVHRDLKPANIKVRPDGTVKVLDFGLAKAVAPDSGVVASDAPVDSPTITSPAMTMRGVILGTAAYMSPEQAKGKPVDRRADIWAFGCVLYEMLTGRRLFKGEDVSDTLASVLRAEPRWNALPAGTPERVRTLLRRCLERDVTKRLPHIGVARLELSDDIVAGEDRVVVPDSTSRWRTHAAWAVAAALLATGAAYGIRSAPAAAPSPTYRFEIRPPDEEVFPGASQVPRFAVSPDGSQVVFASSLPGRRDRLYVRRFGSLEADFIEGTETEANFGDGLQQPFFSPDGRFVAFFSGAESVLKRVPVAGGAVERIARVPTQNPGGTWRGDVLLVSSVGTRGVQKVSTEGGDLTPVTFLDAARGEIAHLWPHLLPDGVHFLYFAQAASGDSAIHVASLNGGPSKRLVASPGLARFAAPDQLLFPSAQGLLTQRLDLETMALVGEPTVVSESIMVAENTRVGLSTSDTGVVVFASGQAAAGNYDVLVRQRSGAPSGSGVLESSLFSPWVRLSPHGSALVFSRESARVGDGPVGPSTQNGPAAPDIWVTSLERGVTNRVSTAPGTDQTPIWTPDGRRVVYQARRPDDGRSSLYERDVAAVVPARLLVTAEPEHLVVPETWSPDGRDLVYRDVHQRAGRADLMRFSSSPTPHTSTYLADGFRNIQAALSPDGRWLAYSSNEGGRMQVFLRSFPDATQLKYQVSSAGGALPRWRRDGRELYYVGEQNQVVAVPIGAGDVLAVGKPTPLFVFPSSIDPANGPGGALDVFPDGQRFVVVAPRSDVSTSSLTVAVNWMTELKP